MDRCYYANELVTFAKLRADRTNCGLYLLVGYLNNDRTKFKDVLSGKIYPLGVSVCAGDTPRANRSVVVDGQSFILVDMKTEYPIDTVKRRFIKFSHSCIFNKVMSEPFVDYSNKEYPRLYDFVNKKNDTQGVVTKLNLFEMAKEINRRTDRELNYYFRNAKADNSLPINKNISLTKEERDF